MNRKPEPIQHDVDVVRALMQGLAERVRHPSAGQADELTRFQNGDYGLLETARNESLKGWSAPQQYAAMQLAIMNALPANVALLDTDGTIVSVNSGWREFARSSGLLTQNFAIGANYLDICDRVHDENAADVQRTAAAIRAILNGKSREFVHEYPCHAPGKQRWFRLMVTPLNELQPVGAVVMHVDITDRKLTEQALEENQALLQGLIDNSPSLIFIKDLDGRYLVVNRQYRDRMGFTEEQILGHRDLDIYSKEQSRQFRTNDLQVLKQQRALTFEETAEYVDGPRISVVTKFPLRDSSGKIYAVAGIATDVTAQKQAELALRESENQFRALFEHAGIGIALVSCEDGRILRCNDVLAGMFGYSNAELCRLTARDISDPEDYERDRALGEELRAGKCDRYQMEKRYLTKDGHWLWGLLTVTLVRDEAGQPRFLIGMVENIDDRKRAEQAAQLAIQQLKNSETQYRLLFQANPQPMWVFDAQTLRFLAVNAAAIEHYGWTEQEFLAMTIRDIRPPEELPRLEQNMQNLDSGRQKSLDIKHRTKSGEIIEVEVVTDSISFDGIPARLVLAHDVTKRSQAERALRASQASMAAAQHVANVGSWEIDLVLTDEQDENTVRWSDEMFRIAGYEPGEVHVTPELFFEHVHPDDREKVRLAVEHAIRDRGGYSMMHRFTRRDGVERVIQEMGQLIYDPRSGQPLKMLGTAYDITDQKLAQSELARTNRALMMLSSCNEVLIRSYEEVDLLERICRIAVEIGGYRMAWVGYANNDATGSILPMAYAGHEAGYLSDLNLSWHADNRYGQGPSGRAIRSGEVVMVKNFAEDPNYRPWLKQAQQRGYRGSVSLPLHDGNRSFGVLNLYISDDSEFAEEEVKLLKELANDLAFGILNLRAQQDNRKLQSALRRVATSVSASGGTEFFENLAHSMAEAVGADIAMVTRFHPGEPVTARTVAAVIDGVVIENFDYSLADTPWAKHPDDNEAVVSRAMPENYPGSPCVRFGAEAYVGRRLISSAGQAIGELFVAFRQPVEQKGFIASTLKIFGARAAAELERQDAERARELLEKQLIQAQKMEAIGTLAGGIAHDFNNILAAILGNAALAREDIPADSGVFESLAEIEKAGQRAKELVQQILSFSRKQPTERRAVELFPIIEESVQLLRATLPARVEVILDNDSFKPTVLGDPIQIEQVLLNLGSNAVQAMDGKPGRIHIRCEQVGIDSMPAAVIAQLQPGEYARISVTDDGHGMDKVTLQRIFEPFFTTKPVGEGTGLGLSSAHGIMRLHDGMIDVSSERGKGSRFDLYFPVSQMPALKSLVQQAQADAMQGRGQHILYIDDDEAIVFLIRRILERLGYRVSAYTDQQAALKALQSDPDGIDLFLSDYNMPGMSGVDLARLCQTIRPELPVVLLSGYITDELRKQAASNGIRELIFKPNAMQELGGVVQRLLQENTR